MRKHVVLALMLIFALLVTSGCGIVVKDAAVDRETVIIEVAGKTFTKGQVMDEVSNTMDYQEYIYSMYGMTYDKTNADVIASAREQVLQGLVQQAVIDQKENDLGMNSFTPEELTQLQTKVDETYASNFDSVKASYFAETELTSEELDAAIAEKMKELGYGDKETLLENEKKTSAYDKLKADVVKDVTVSDEEIQTRYQEKVAEAKTSYESDLSSYGAAVRSGSTVYYHPAGYRYVKNLLRKLSEEDTTAISALKTQVTEKQNELTTVENSLVTMNADATQDTPEQAKSRQELADSKTQLAQELADLKTQLDTTEEAAYAKVKPSVDEILQKLTQGGEFDALMAESGEDDGMKASPAMETGYLVCEGDENWVPEFTTAAMKLAKVGDVSPAVRSNYGIHLLKYAGDLQEGEVPLEDVKEALKTEMLTEKQDTQFNATLEQWVKEANAKVYADRLN